MDDSNYWQRLAARRLSRRRLLAGAAGAGVGAWRRVIPTLYMGEVNPAGVPWHYPFVTAFMATPEVCFITGAIPDGLVTQSLRDRYGWRLGTVISLMGMPFTIIGVVGAEADALESAGKIEDAPDALWDMVVAQTQAGDLTGALRTAESSSPPRRQ